MSARKEGEGKKFYLNLEKKLLTSFQDYINLKFAGCEL